MPYTDDPANVLADAVRFYVGDTNNLRLLMTDAEVAFLLGEEGNHPLRAAARAAETIAAKYTKEASLKKVGPLQINNSTSSGLTKAQEYMALARRLWARTGNRGAPFAGGIDRMDKATRAQDPTVTRPAFSRHMFEYRPGEPQEATEEDLLGRDYDAP